MAFKRRVIEIALLMYYMVATVQRVDIKQVPSSYCLVPLEYLW